MHPIAIADCGIRDLENLQGRPRPLGLNPAAHFDAADVRKVDIQHDEVRQSRRGERQRVMPAHRLDDLEAGAPQQLGLDETSSVLVVDDEHQRGRSRHGSG
jgi:hypothetical protein